VAGDLFPEFLITNDLNKANKSFWVWQALQFHSTSAEKTFFELQFGAFQIKNAEKIHERGSLFVPQHSSTNFDPCEIDISFQIISEDSIRRII
jgi:hypothetical protein